MIEIKNVTFGYRKKSKLFNDISLSFEAGKIHGLFGVNGAGKTTLLQLMSGLLKPSEGKIDILGKDIDSLSANVLSQMFLVPEDFELPSIKIEKFVALNEPFYSKFDKDLFASIMREFEMHENENLSEISYGQKKKFLISFAIATQTPIILFDEPTNGLDILSKSQFRRIMARFTSDDRCFVISTHQVRDLSSIIDNVLIIDNGKIAFNQSIYDISKTLVFRYITEDIPEDTLFSEDVGMGKSVIVKAMEDESEVDLETLFNAVIKDKAIINSAFKSN